jgi:hypothetical protein
MGYTQDTLPQKRHSHNWNLGDSGSRVRLYIGFASLGITITLAGYFYFSNIESYWRWSLFPVLSFSLLTLAQARFKLCFVLALLGAWDLGCGPQKIPDQRLEKVLRRRAIYIGAIAILVAFLLNLLFVCL